MYLPYQLHIDELVKSRCAPGMTRLLNIQRGAGRKNLLGVEYKKFFLLSEESQTLEVFLSPIGCFDH